MAQRYGFFNSVNNDRVYDASDVARFLKKFFTNGVFNNTLQVKANNNMTVSVSVGQANIEGYSYENDEELILDIADADSTLPRIDSVIVRLDLNNRQIATQILQGNYASTPSQPTIIRTDSVYDLRLANILVSAGETRITADMITDTRFTSDCGNVVGAVQQLDTDDIFRQYETMFNNWFSELQVELDGDVAANLENQIIRLENKTDQTNNALNELSENFNPVILYEGQEATSITLSEPINEFKKIKISVYSSDGHSNTIEILKDIGISAITTSVLLGSVSGTTYYGKTARILIDGANLTVDRTSEVAIRNNNSSVVSASANAIAVYKVIGYYEY